VTRSSLNATCGDNLAAKNRSEYTAFVSLFSGMLLLISSSQFCPGTARMVGFLAWLLAGLPFCSAQSAAGQETPRFYVREYRIDGAKRLNNLEVGEAVYPYLGPGRTPDDVEQARQTLEKVYHDKGYQTVSVSIPQQDPRRGIIRLEVTEGKVGRLRVTGARWFLPSRIKSETPSVAEGSVPNFNEVSKDMMAVNRLADRRVTPELKPGMEAGTVDIDLKVEDKSPLHGSLELNNRYSADTTQLRLNAAISYANLFQLGHTLGVNLQVAPENTDDALVYSAFYLARVSDKTSLLFQATKQDSDISTLGGAAVAGKGETLGMRALVDLPTGENFHQSFNIGIDHKSFEEDLKIGGVTIPAPIEYYPISANHAAAWMSDKSYTELNNSLNFGLRGLGSDQSDFDNKRFNASSSFIYLRSDASHTRDLKNGARVFGKLQGQAAGGPLINNEQFAGGGLGSVRGYLEATVLGDYGVAGSVEVRSPTLIGGGEKDLPGRTPGEEWRFHAFLDAAVLGIHDALPGQKSRSRLASMGVGSRIRWREHYNGSVDVAMPLIEQLNADDGSIRLTFRGWADF
jgi:hemolysin activation/secretion protein